MSDEDYGIVLTPEQRAFQERVSEIATPVKKRGSHRYHLGAKPSDAVAAVKEAAERLGPRGRTMKALQKAAAPHIEGCTSQKKWAEAKRDAFVEIGKQLDVRTRYPGTKVEFRDVPLKAEEAKPNG